VDEKEEGGELTRSSRREMKRTLRIFLRAAGGKGWSPMFVRLVVVVVDSCGPVMVCVLLYSHYLQRSTREQYLVSNVADVFQ